MAEQDITKQQAARHLGQVVEYKTDYDAGLLVAVERIHNRTKYGIDETNLPFVGYDTWNAYEVSFLLDNGFPISCVAKIVYASDSTAIVESKSLKLYLNSFNMSKFGKTTKDAVANVEHAISTDLSELLAVDVAIKLHFTATNDEITFSNPSDEYIDLAKLVHIEDEVFNTFNESPDILEAVTDAHLGVLQVQTNLLRSNCRITSQPDWGDAYIHIKGDNLPTTESLLQYIVSFRKEDHFHEEVCEMIYKRLLDKFSPDELMVTCLYTRRGGIDICPARATHSHLLSENLGSVSDHIAKTLRQ